MSEFLWAEKYRPRKIDDCILPNRLKDEFHSIVAGGELPNMLFWGEPGGGKTTIAHALCEEMDMQPLIINASMDGNIETLRTTIQTFATTRSITSQKKVVILDEADYLNAQSTQPALRNFIEEYSQNCRFIFTANYPKKIINPLHSRLRSVKFVFNKAEQRTSAQELMVSLERMLNLESVKYSRDDLAKLIIQYSPDYRKIINEMQSLSITGTLDSNQIISLVLGFDGLIDYIIKKDFVNARSWVAENSDMGFTSFMKIRKPLELKLKDDSIPNMFMILNEFDRQLHNISDIEIHFIACIVSLMYDLEYK